MRISGLQWDCRRILDSTRRTVVLVNPEDCPGKTSRELSNSQRQSSLSPFHLGCTDFCASSSPEDQLCKEWFPRLPSVFALVARTPVTGCKNDEAMLQRFERIHLQVQRLLRDAWARVYLHPPGTDIDALVALLEMVSVNDQPLRLEDGGYTWAGTTFPNGPQLTRLINDWLRLRMEQSSLHSTTTPSCSASTPNSSPSALFTRLQSLMWVKGKERGIEEQPNDSKKQLRRESGKVTKPPVSDGLAGVLVLLASAVTWQNLAYSSRKT